ncbi:MAG: DUF1018 domain-containing protein [Azospirillum sp.]|nr:DUF1018 domain-containing protein [Azospirillum sp.]
MAITSDKIRLIQAAKRRLGLADDDYRAILRMFGGVESSRDLDMKGFKAVLDRFSALGFQSTANRRAFGDHREGMATAGEVAKIRKLWAGFTADQGTDASLGKWLEKRFKVSSIRFVTDALAPKVITALVAMNKRQAEKTATASAPAA